MRFCSTITATRLRITDTRLIMATLRFFYFYLSIALCADESTAGEPRKIRRESYSFSKVPECPAPADKPEFFVSSIMESPKSKR